MVGEQIGKLDCLTFAHDRFCIAIKKLVSIISSRHLLQGNSISLSLTATSLIISTSRCLSISATAACSRQKLVRSRQSIIFDRKRTLRQDTSTIEADFAVNINIVVDC